MKNAIAAIAGILTIVAAIPYMRDIIRGKTKPNIVSWATWTMLLAIATAAAFAAHKNRTALLTVGDTIGTGLTLILGIKYGIAKFSWFDGACQVAAIIGVILWIIFNSPTVAIVAAMVIDGFASMPTIRHGYLNPEEETTITFGLVSIAAALTVLSLSEYSTDSLTFPIYLFVANAAIVIAVFLGTRRKESRRSKAGKKPA